jgi:hypothetical protein
MLLFVWLYSFSCQAEPIYRTVDVPENKMLAASHLLEDVAGSLGITYSLYNSAAPEIVLRGEPESINQMTTLLEECFQGQSVNSLLNIRCSLHSLQEGDVLNLGLLPPGGVQATGTYQRYNTSTGGVNQAYDIWNLTISTISDGLLKLQQGLDKGTTLIAGDITAENGLSGDLKSKKSLPLVVTTSSSVTSSVTYKDVVTEVKVLPTVIDYNEEKPEESKIRLDIHVKISNVKKVTYTESAYPYIVTREYDITRIIKANSQPYITAAIARDTKLKTDSGIPLLKDLPLLKYIFGSQYTRNVREYDILKINVGWVKK